MERIARDTYTERGPSDVNPTQWAAMRYLRRAALESRTPAHLARFLGVTPAPVSRCVASLERRGLVARHPNPTDRRSVVLELTPKGLDVLDHDPIERLAVAVDRLDDDERRALEFSLESIAGLMSGAPRD